MPTITLDRNRFSSYVGRKLSVEEMAKWLPWLGTNTEEIGSDFVKIEYNPNRVDFCSHSGIARAFQGLMGLKTGIINYKVKNHEDEIIVIAYTIHPFVNRDFKIVSIPDDIRSILLEYVEEA